MPKFNEGAVIPRGPLSIVHFDPVIEFPEAATGNEHLPFIFYRRKAVFDEDKLYLVSNARWNRDDLDWDQIDGTHPSYRIIYDGNFVTHQGMPSGSGSWIDSAWVEATRVIPTGAGRQLTLYDLQIQWGGVTTGASGGNPPAQTALNNVLTPKNTVKAWGEVRVTNGNVVTVQNGFGIGLPTVIAGDLNVVLANLMGTTLYPVVATENEQSFEGLTATVHSATKTGTAFRIRLRLEGGGAFTIGGATSCIIGFIVMGIHT